MYTSGLWLSISIVAVVFIVLGYIVLFKTIPEADEVFIIWSSRMKICWGISFCISVVCFLILHIYLVFFMQEEEYNHNKILAFTSYCLLLFSTVLWLPFTVIAKTYSELKFVVVSILFVTAIASILFVIAMASISLMTTLLALPLAIHCTLIDGIIWCYCYMYKL